MIKRGKVTTLGGDYWYFLPLERGDFYHEVKEPIYSSHSKMVFSEVEVHMFEDMWKAMLEVFEDDVWELVDCTGLTDRFAVSHEKYRDLKPLYVSIREEASMRGLRTEEKKKSRIASIKKTVTDRIGREVESLVNAEIAKVNERIKMNMIRHNEKVKDTMMRGLEWFEPWVELADEKGETSALKKKIKQHEETLAKLNKDLQEARSKAFMETLDEQDWKYQGYIMPMEMRVEAEQMLTDGRAFQPDVLGGILRR